MAGCGSWTRTGKPVSTDKIMYGQSFVMYCMSECALATGNAVGPRCRRRNLHTRPEVRGGHRLGRIPRNVPARLAAAPVRRLRRGPQELRRAHAPHGGVHHALRAHRRRDPPEEAPGSDRRAVEPHVPRPFVDRASHSSPWISRRFPPSCSRRCGAPTGTTRGRRGR